MSPVTIPERPQDWVQQNAIEGAPTSWGTLGFGAGARGAIPVSNMPRACGGANLTAQAANDIQGSCLFLAAGQVINRIAVQNRTTAGATLTHRWAGIWTPGGLALGRQSTDIVTATTTTNAMLEHVLTSAYTVPVDGVYIVGVYFAGGTIPTLAGASVGLASLADSPSLTGVTSPHYAWRMAVGSATATAPAAITFTASIANVTQFWVY